jgi:hypothetical protein
MNSRPEDNFVTAVGDYTPLNDDPDLTIDTILAAHQLNALIEMHALGLEDPEVSGIAVIEGEEYIIHIPPRSIRGKVAELNSIQDRIYEKLVSAAKTGVSLQHLQNFLLAATHNGAHKLILRFIENGDESHENIRHIKKDFYLENIHSIARELKYSNRQHGLFDRVATGSESLNEKFDRYLKAFYKLGGKLTKAHLKLILPCGTFCRLVNQDLMQNCDHEETSFAQYPERNKSRC